MNMNSLKNEQKSPFYIAEFEQPFEACKVGTNYAVYEAYQKSRKIDPHAKKWPLKTWWRNVK